MSNYDKIVFGDRPTLYLSAPDITDKSGTSNFSLSNNNLSVTGQPIIYGSEFSYLGDADKTVDVTGNPLFFNDTASLECVIYAGRPEEDVPIIIDDNSQNALLITSEGITLKLFFDNALSTYSQAASVRIKDWNKKLYIIVTITNNQATLSVNGKSAILTYVDTIVESSNVIIGGGYTGYKYLMDGLAFYTTTVKNKVALISDSETGYTNYIRKIGGLGTKFQAYPSAYKESFTLEDFIFSEGEYTLIYLVSCLQEGLDYITVRVNDERVPVYYDINLDDSGTFNEYLLLTTIDDSALRFVVDATAVESDFTLTIEAVCSSDLLYETPADLVLSGLALYGEPSDSIVNYFDGTKLPGAAYTGTWMLSDDFIDVPSTIELTFRPVESENDTVVFASSDGSATFGPTGGITGYTAYLNGQLVTDLADIRYDQWNHLVLLNSSAASTEFYLNSDDGLAGEERSE